MNITRLFSYQNWKKKHKTALCIYGGTMVFTEARDTVTLSVQIFDSNDITSLVYCLLTKTNQRMIYLI
jgi:hypothetical protein